MNMERTPTLAELDMLFIIQIILVSKKDRTTLSNQCGQLLALLLSQLGELDTVKLGSKLGSVIDALSHASKEGLLLGIGAEAGDAGGVGVAVGQGCVLVVGGEDNVFSDEGSHYCVFRCVLLGGCWFC